MGVYHRQIAYLDGPCWRFVMKKQYLAPSIMIIEYNHVDIVTSSVLGDYTHVKDSWLDADWLN